MKSIDLIKQGFVSVFSGDDCCVKHFGLFAISGILALFTVNFQTMAESFEASQVMPNIGEIVLGVLAILVLSIYLCGYNFVYMYNVHHDGILPNLDGKPFMAFLKALPLIIVWYIYFMIVGLIFALSAILLKLLAFILILLFIVFVAFCLPFVFVIFSKEFDSKGLFNPILPSKFISAIGIISVIMLWFIIINIAIYIPIGILGGIVGALGGGVKTAAYVGGIIGGYAGVITQLVFAYCLIQIYKERFEEEC